MIKVNIEELVDGSRLVISGREVGRKFREKLGGEEFFAHAEVFEVMIPSSTKVVTPSVFLGLMGAEMRKTGSLKAIKHMFKLSGASVVTEDNFMTAARTSLAKPF